MARYVDAVAWIANNDEPTILEADEIDGMMTVLLVADLWEKPSADVARHIATLRRKGVLLERDMR